MESQYHICSRCIMDTSDPEISFNAQGLCSHCQRFDAITKPNWQKTLGNTTALESLIETIKREGKGKQYDCIMGLSGGVDSSYVATLVKKYGLRPLAVHFDSGWNSELASNNIENIVNKLDIDLFTIVCDWEEMKDLQLSFFKASLPNCDIPQDHAFVAALYKTAIKKNIKYLISGHNTATESILPKEWGYTSRDLVHLKSVHKTFGKLSSLKKYPQLSFFNSSLYYPYVKGIKSINILNYLDYNKKLAKEYLIEKLDWRDYGGKHYESGFTKFFQSYYLPVKFGYDKRRAHLASLIVTGQIDRTTALKEMEAPAFDSAIIEDDISYMAKKMGISSDEFTSILMRPNKTHRDYGYNKILDYFRERRFKSA
jgi:N-acetyl sugar amidotransferase